MTSPVRISESGRKEDKPFMSKNGEERKRNPRKEKELRAISGNEEERAYVNFPHQVSRKVENPEEK